MSEPLLERATTSSQEIDPPVNTIANDRGVILFPERKQDFAVVSIRVRKEPMKLPNGKFVAGIFKVRFVGTSDECEKFAEAIISSEVPHCRYDFLIVPVGKFAMFSDDPRFVGELKPVRSGEDPNENDASRMVSREAFKTEQQAAKEALKRLEHAQKGPAAHDDPLGLDFEVYKRVTFIRLVESILAAERKIKEMKEKLGPVHTVLKQLDIRFPERCPVGLNSMTNGDWLGRYNEERRRSGICDYIPGRLIEEAYEKYEGEVGVLDVDSLVRNPLLPGDVMDTVLRAPVMGQVPGTALKGAVVDEEIPIPK